MVNLDWLKTFCTLVETGHFTRTAEKLAMTQPGVSQQIRKLEQHYRQPLLLREGKRFTLTEAGQQVYLQAQNSLAQLDKLELDLQIDDPYSGHCRLASPGSLGMKIYPELVNFQQQHPGLIIDYQFAPNGSIEQLLASRQLDLALITRPPEMAELSGRVFAEESLYLVTPAHIQQPNWETLMGLGYINHPDGEHHSRQLLSANYPEFEQFSQLPIKGFSNQIGLILEPVSRGLGFTVLPAHAVAAFHQPEAIQYHKLPHPVSETVYLVQRRYRSLPHRFQRITERIAELLEAETTASELKTLP